MRPSELYYSKITPLLKELNIKPTDSRRGTLTLERCSQRVNVLLLQSNPPKLVYLSFLRFTFHIFYLHLCFCVPNDFFYLSIFLLLSIVM